MKFIEKLTIAFAVLCLLTVVGCDDKEQFLKRNTQSLDFSYTRSSATFTVRATGQWYISDAPGTNSWTGAYDWVSVDKLSGIGDGKTYDQITVTCQANSSEARTAYIYLQGCGEKDVQIELNQDNGLFEFTNSLSIPTTLKKDVQSSAYIRIPYQKALGDESVYVEVVQTGGDGLSVEGGTYYITEAGSGNFDIPITGTPTTQGAVSFVVTVMTSSGFYAEPYEFDEVSSVVRGGYDENGDEIYLVYQDFNGLIWGGDPIADLEGVTPAEWDSYTTTIGAETKTCSATTTGASGAGVCSTIRQRNTQLFNDLGMTGWTGYTNYMFYKYMVLGTSSTNTLGQPGSLVSPAFAIPSDAKMLLVNMKLATWTTHHDLLEVGICTKHDGFYTWINESNYNSRYVNAVKYRTNLDVKDITLSKWIDYSVMLSTEGLSSSTEYCVYITYPEELWNEDGTVPPGQMCVDDIKVVY